MSVLQASSAGVKDMADGSLRITFEFEPRHAAEAFALFGPRGRAVAVAALRDGFAAVGGGADEQTPEPPKGRIKVGPLCREAVGYCEMSEFWVWIGFVTRCAVLRGSDEAKEWLLEQCGGIESRKELDADPVAAQLFVERVRMPFMRWQKSRAKESAHA